MAAPVINNKPSTGIRGEDYSFIFDITADVPPTTQIVGTLPTGLSLSDSVDSYNPVISGVPEELGTFSFSIVVISSQEDAVIADCIITINNRVFSGFYR